MADSASVLRAWKAPENLGLNPQLVEAGFKRVTATPRGGTQVFYVPLVQTLGDLTQYIPGHLLPLDEIRSAVLRRMSWDDPSKLPEGLTLDGRSSGGGGAGILRRIQLAYTGLYGWGQPITWKGPTGQWGLTPLGVVVSMRLNNITPQTDNPTKRWLDQHLRPKPGQRESVLMAVIRSAIIRKCPRSARSDKVDDHIQEFLCRLIRRDGLRKKILAGETISYKHIASFAVRSAFSDHRSGGTEPVERALYDARTWCERKSNQDRTPANVRYTGRQNGVRYTASDAKVALQWDRVKGEDDKIKLDLVDPNDYQLLVEERADFERTWARIEDVMKRAKPKAWERYAAVLAMKVNGASTQQIAEAEQVSEYRASAMLQEARRVIREHGFDQLRA